MSDPRLTPDPARVTHSSKARIIAPIADLNRQPGKRRDRQMLFGEQLTVLGYDGDHSYIVTEKDGYVGFISTAAIGPNTPITHRISAPATHAYSEPSMKSAERLSLSHGSLVNVIATDEKFAETDVGYIPLQHVKPNDQHETDPIAVARLFLGTPYLWGGNSRAGIDCSGLIQAALTACNIPCPGDSHQQEKQLGTALSPDAPAQAGDLYFWKGHVALAIDQDTLIHANAHHMGVAYEPIKTAISRIKNQGDGDVTAHKRLISFG